MGGSSSGWEGGGGVGGGKGEGLMSYFKNNYQQEAMMDWMQGRKERLKSGHRSILPQSQNTWRGCHLRSEASSREDAASPFAELRGPRGKVHTASARDSPPAGPAVLSCHPLPAGHQQRRQRPHRRLASRLLALRLRKSALCAGTDSALSGENHAPSSPLS